MKILIFGLGVNISQDHLDWFQSSDTPVQDSTTEILSLTIDALSSQSSKILLIDFVCISFLGIKTTEANKSLKTCANGAH